LIDRFSLIFKDMGFEPIVKIWLIISIDFMSLFGGNGISAQKVLALLSSCKDHLAISFLIHRLRLWTRRDPCDLAPFAEEITCHLFRSAYQ
jgi:hypothetical protein